MLITLWSQSQAGENEVQFACSQEQLQVTTLIVIIITYNIYVTKNDTVIIS